MHTVVVGRDCKENSLVNLEHVLNRKQGVQDALLAIHHVALQSQLGAVLSQDKWGAWIGGAIESQDRASFIRRLEPDFQAYSIFCSRLVRPERRLTYDRG